MSQAWIERFERVSPTPGRRVRAAACVVARGGGRPVRCLPADVDRTETMLPAPPNPNP